MVKYPPIIEGTLPAFYYYEDDGTVTAKLTVPFFMNKSVSINDIKGIALKLKTVTNNNFIISGKTIFSNDEKQKLSQTGINEVSFEILIKDSENKNLLNVGQHYKVQIAYIFNDKSESIGYYSTVGVVKYTSPATTISIESSNDNTLFYGKYSQTVDKTERVYSYEFNIYDETKQNIIATSGQQIHDISNDEITTEELISYDTFEYNMDFPKGKQFYIEYKVKTLNNASFTSEKLSIIQHEGINSFLNADIFAFNDREEGSINISLKGHSTVYTDEETEDEYKILEEPATGQFRLLRASADDNFNQWHELYYFNLVLQKPSLISYKDYLIESGKTYRYAIQEYNDKQIFSNKKIYCDITTDYEHAYLSDGKRQLKIKYNPKISSFKEILLEQKTNTIGSKYPFIFRNGNVRYKEFPISGLISCQSDDNYLFMDEEDLALFDGTSNLTSENVTTEKKFKLKVLEWLNNGEPKVFRSSTEGNYIVRIMNVSLSPNDTLGRMIHTFSATATEIAEYNYENLLKYNFVHVEHKESLTYAYDILPKSEFSQISKVEYKSKQEEIYPDPEHSDETVLDSFYNRLIDGRQPVIFHSIKAKWRDDIQNSNNYTFTFKINGILIDIKNSKSFEILDFDNLQSLTIGEEDSNKENGVAFEVIYDYNEITYEGSTSANEVSGNDV